MYSRSTALLILPDGAVRSEFMESLTNVLTIQFILADQIQEERMNHTSVELLSTCNGTCGRLWSVLEVKLIAMTNHHQTEDKIRIIHALEECSNLNVVLMNHLDSFCLVIDDHTRNASIVEMGWREILPLDPRALHEGRERYEESATSTFWPMKSSKSSK